MSLALQVNSPELESNQAARGAVPCRPDGEEEDPSVLSDLTAMFPSMDQDVIVSVLQAHDGRIQGAVEYLMSAGEQELSRATLPLLLADLSVVDPARDMMGQFSEAIGGLPEVLPRFLYEEEGEEGESDDEENGLEREEERDRRRSFPTAPPQGGDDSDDDPLPTYDEACEESASQFPLIAQEDGSGSHAGAAARHISESETGVEPHVATTEPPAEDASAEVGTIKTPPSTDKKSKISMC